MGVVWKAEDLVLGRPVAIKVLPPEAALNENRRRMFVEEARLASSLNDAHIVQVHELGQQDGLDFIVMEYVPGKDLGSLAHGKALPVSQIVHLGHQIAQALSRAHRKGLLHRDLKPANVLVTADGDAKVLDFGLATLLAPPEDSSLALDPSELSTRTSAGPQTDPETTRSCAPLAGTLPYMSPEQCRGETLDSRSDIFSLGTILYELSVGRRPFTGASSAELLKDIQRGRPRQPHDLAPKLPIDLDRIIMKALAANRSDRYQTMDDLAVDLKRLARELESGSSPSFEDLGGAAANRRPRRRVMLVSAAAVAVGLLALGAWALYSRSHLVDARTVMVAPFDVPEPGERSAFVGRAFAETVAVNLADVEELKIVPVPDGAAGREASIAAARSAKAGSLLLGMLSRTGSQVELSASLIDVKSNRLLWGKQDTGDKAALSTMAVSLADEVEKRLAITPRPLYDLWYRYTKKPELARSQAYAIAYAARKKHDRAGEASARLVAEFPDEPESWQFRVSALIRLAWDLPESAPEWKAAEEAFAHLRQLAPQDPSTEDFRATMELGQGHPDRAGASYSHILARTDLTASLRAQVLAHRAETYSARAQPDLALADLAEATRLDPADGGFQMSYAYVLARAGRYEKALDAVRLASAIQGPTLNARIEGWILYKLGRWKEASESLEPFCTDREDSFSCAHLAVTRVLEGRLEEAKVAQARALTLRETALTPCSLARYHALTHRTDEALKAFRHCVELGYLSTQEDLDEGRADPGFDPLRGNPEFEALLAAAADKLRAASAR